MIDENSSSNTSGNRPFEEVLTVNNSRRTILSGGLGAAATTFFAPLPSLAANDKEKADRQGEHNALVGFTPVPVAGGGGKTPRIAPEYTFDIILPWGDPIAPGSAERIGIGHDGMSWFPLRAGNEHGLLVVNHEYGDNAVVLGKNRPEDIHDVEVSQYAHGVSVIELKKENGRWQPVNTSGYARRIHVNSRVAFSGPVAGSSLLHNLAGNLPRGTLNNCANGMTPWGTYLTCEENFHGYFGANTAWTLTAEQRRYGFSTNSGYGWHLFDERFDLSNPGYANEDKRFGWIVEIDPRRPDSLPVKRTALGRFKHEGIAITVGRGGRVVGYMGDDERFDYIYKFVSEKNWKAMLAQDKSPLDHGRLYAARFNDDGTGDWLELNIANPVLRTVFNNQAEVLTFARQAADMLGATPMDRPEWTTVAPNGLVYCTLTNNSARTSPDAANPLAPNRHGHIIRWFDSDNHVGLKFRWDIFSVAQGTQGTEESFASPDGLWADPEGRLFIQTDGGQNDGLNNQMLVADIHTGQISRLFEGVAGSEVTGIATTPDQRTLFCNLQHPDPDSSVPRDATVVITRLDGGVVGS